MDLHPRWQQAGMGTPEPRDEAGAKVIGKLHHLRSLTARYAARAFVVAYVSLLAKRIQLGNQRLIATECERERLYGPIMMGLARDAIALGRQAGRGDLKGRIIGNRKLPIRAQS